MTRLKMFSDVIDLRSLLERTRKDGYAFAPRAATERLCGLLAGEMGGLPMEHGDHERYPINKSTANEVRQLHERCYRPIGHADVPVGTALCEGLAEAVGALGIAELAGWLPNEIGYQRYRDGKDWISPHRDRASDKLLSVTITIAGSAKMRIYEAETDPPDYARLRQTDEVMTESGTMMFLRAPGFGSGTQVIHEVLPPECAPRLILNLRMRPTVLKPPAETRWR